MKTQLSKPPRHNARYTQEYKQEALQLWRNSGRSAAKVAAELGIRAPLLYRWARPKRQSNSSASESQCKQSVEELEAEIRRLRAENANLLEQREVLKNRWASSPKRRREVCPNLNYQLLQLVTCHMSLACKAVALAKAGHFFQPLNSIEF